MIIRHARTPSVAMIERRGAVSEPTDPELLEQFVRERDSGAFEVLVRRHGPMVLGVCRRVLGNADDAEDAFQTTFLVLVHKAATLAKPELLGNWLYGVASRVARKARAQGFRRRAVERQAVARVPAHVSAEPDQGQEFHAFLDRELPKLPEKYRVPLTLCYLEGLTNGEAAHRLGWPTGSISYRLARGRELLMSRMR